MTKTVLIGFMGAGKTTAARALAGPAAVDLDHEIESREGRTPQELFAAVGEAGFRAAEERIALEILADPDVEVVALGGGTASSEAVRRALEPHTTVWIDVDAETAWRRVGGDARRPLARDRDAFAALRAEREPIYAAIADVVVPATRTLQVPDVLRAVAAAPAGTRVLWAASASGDYPVFLAEGLLTTHRFWPATVEGRRFLVTDGNAGRHYGEALEPLTGRVVVMPGEASKTVAHAEIVWTELARAGLTRRDVVVALGGGVVGDLGGFCAATYQRGVPVVQVPTTLVAQVDSAYGGKTGVDLPEAKNYVGAYHQPAAVIVDPATLASLPEAEVAAGYAEVVKTALIAGGELWERVAAGADPADPAVISACALTKLRVVAEDERDGGRRQVLNLGHTVAHAIETITGYVRYRHGEAVGLGLLAALRLSGQDALRGEVEALLAGRGLPVRIDTEVDLDAVVMATRRDKKRIGEGPTPFVLLDGPGHPRHGCEVAAGDLVGAVRELRP